VKPHRLIAVVGPTAGGKTSKAIDLALQHKTEIVSFDSRQFYQELNIGVARPSQEELLAVPHHLIAHASIHEPISAGVYPDHAWPILQRLFLNNETVIAVGGSGLFLKVLLDGIDQLPSDENVRNHWMSFIQAEGPQRLTLLQEKLKELDPDYYLQVDKLNPHRLVRALEVITITGKKFSELRTDRKQTLPFEVEYVYINPPKEILHERICTRVEKMMDDGLWEEAEALFPLKHLQPLNTVGYKELFDVMDGPSTLSEAVEWIQIHTRQYAKRQVTWFNKMLNESRH
jgi:tRNA dimethylallyltransferase